MATTMHHQLLGIDEGCQRLSLIDTAQAEMTWTLDLASFPSARDLQRLDRDRALVGYERGFFEIEIASGKVLRECGAFANVSAVRRQADGSTLLTGYDLDGTGGINVLTLDARMQVLHSARRDGDYVRLMRPNGNGGYLLCTNDHILDTDASLITTGRLAAPGFEHAWLAQRCNDGATLVSAGYGAFMARFGTDGSCRATFGHAADVPDEVAPFFYASFEQLADGRLLVANWQGHGPDNGHKGRQLVCFGPDGRYLDAWSNPERISSLQGLLLL